MRAAVALLVALTLIVGPTGTAMAGNAKQDIREILKDPRFKQDVPLGSDGEPPVQQTKTNSVEAPESQPRSDDWLTKALSRVPLWVWIVIGVIVLLIAIRLLTRRAERAPEDDKNSEDVTDRPKKPSSAQELEREADRAEAAGRFNDAVRLRFEGGVLRLIEADLVTAKPGLTSGQISSTLRSAKFVEIACAFDEIVYGQRAATSSDAEQAKTTWPAVLSQATGK